MMPGAEDCVACHNALPHSRRDHRHYILEAVKHGRRWEDVPLLSERPFPLGGWLLAGIVLALVLIGGGWLIDGVRHAACGNADWLSSMACKKPDSITALKVGLGIVAYCVIGYSLIALWKPRGQDPAH